LPTARPYLDYDFLELENITAESVVRPVTLGRKNYLLMGSETGGKSAAIAYTLIETCKLNKVNPEAWVLGVGCWVLGVGCWVLGVGCWVLGVGCWVLGVGCWLLVVGCWGTFRITLPNVSTNCFHGSIRQ